MNHLTKSFFFATIVALVIGVSSTLAQSTAFTYQGKLTDGGNPANLENMEAFYEVRTEIHLNQ